MTITLHVLIDAHEGKRLHPKRLAAAVARAINHALESDIEGAEYLNPDVVGQITVKEGRPT